MTLTPVTGSWMLTGTMGMLLLAGPGIVPGLGRNADDAAFKPVLLLTLFDGTHSRGGIGPRRDPGLLVRRPDLQ